jgi:hypothetical protein
MNNTGHELAGNYERCVMHPTALAAGKPEFIREGLIPHMFYFETLPQDITETMKQAKFAVVTNWASITSLVKPAGITLVAHAPGKAFVTGLAFDIAIIFEADTKGTLMLNHNWRTSAESGYPERLAASTILKQIIL